MFEEKLLVWKFKRGSKDAFALIYQKYVNDLLTLAMNLLHNSAQAEDVVQDVLETRDSHLRKTGKSANLSRHSFSEDGSWINIEVKNRVVIPARMGIEQARRSRNYYGSSRNTSRLKYHVFIQFFPF